MKTTRFVRVRFENWQILAATLALVSAFTSACSGGGNTYIATGGAGGIPSGAGGDSAAGSGGDKSSGSAGDPGSDGGSAGLNAGGRAGGGQPNSGGAGGSQGGSIDAGGFGGASGSINVGGQGGAGGSINVGGSGGSSGSGNAGGASGFGGSGGSGGAGGSAGASGFGGTSGASGASGAGGSGPLGNLIVNGDFSAGEMYWEFTGGVYPHSVVSGRLCVTLSTANYAIVGWPLENTLAPVLPPGSSYTLSYTAYATQPAEVTFITKVGHAVSPYTPIIEQSRPLTNSPQVFTHSFSTASGDSGAGLAFNITATYYASGNNVCIDDVSLVRTQ